MTTVTVIIVVLVVAALAATAFVMYEKQRSSQLQERFGPEYDRAVEGADSRREAESHLTEVAQKRDKLDVRDLDESERTRFSAEWDVVQARFVDEPGPAVDAAETLIATVMRERGYPVEDFDQRADLVAADHPEVVQHYRDAHSAHERHRSAGGVDTEDLRQSFVHYRALFAALVESTGNAGSVDVKDAEVRDTEASEAEIRSTHTQETR
jgi:hypothetical protein